MNKLRLEQFMQPFMPEIVIWIEYYDHDHQTWRKERATTVHYSLTEDGEGRVLLRADKFQSK